MSRPLAVFVDRPGGPVDQLAANADVTTFLNDRFHPVFLTADPVQPMGTVQFLSADACALSEPLRPADAAALIAAANEVIVLPAASGRQAARFERTCGTPP